MLILLTLIDKTQTATMLKCVCVLRHLCAPLQPTCDLTCKPLLAMVLIRADVKKAERDENEKAQKQRSKKIPKQRVSKGEIKDVSSRVCRSVGANTCMSDDTHAQAGCGKGFAPWLVYRSFNSYCK